MGNVFQQMLRISVNLSLRNFNFLHGLSWAELRIDPNEFVSRERPEGEHQYTEVKGTGGGKKPVLVPFRVFSILWSTEGATV